MEVQLRNSFSIASLQTERVSTIPDSSLQTKITSHSVGPTIDREREGAEMENQPVKWTIMAYMNADNILANFAVESLKQLRNAASPNVRVIAEFADNQPDEHQQRKARLYLFDGQKRDQPIEASLLPAGDLTGLANLSNVDMTHPDTLREFIDFATQNFSADHYCLILWGHGIELLMDDDRRFATAPTSDETLIAPPASKATEEALKDDGEPAARYLTIANLQTALDQSKLAPPKSASSASRTTLDIIGFDACSMSMIEVASAIQTYANYMIASQEDVPDMSFPYEKILKELAGKDVKEVCALLPKLYQEEYRDYIATPGTGVKGITLASLDLSKASALAGPLRKLSLALSQASHVTEKRKAIFSARKAAKDFVFGILADLGDFCGKLQTAFQQIDDGDVKAASKEVLAALALGNDGFVLANQVASNNPGQCSGLSVYFPFRNQKDATENMDEQLSKGTGNRPLKSTGNRPLKGTGNRPLKERVARIRELEADFSKREEKGVKEWMAFIKQGWSAILAEKVGFELDYYYSAEQCAVNLVGRGPTGPADSLAA
jgi:hypothetical protein